MFLTSCFQHFQTLHWNGAWTESFQLFSIYRSLISIFYYISKLLCMLILDITSICLAIQVQMPIVTVSVLRFGFRSCFLFKAWFSGLGCFGLGCLVFVLFCLVLLCLTMVRLCLWLAHSLVDHFILHKGSELQAIVTQFSGSALGK